MAVNFKLGMNAKLYIADAVFTANDAAAVEAATLAEVDNVTNVTVTLETGSADITTRGNTGWRATAATLKDGSIEFEMVWKPSDANFSDIKDAWLNSTEIGVVALTGAIASANNEGPAGNFVVTNFSRDESLEEAIKANVTLKPASYMQWYDTGDSA